MNKVDFETLKVRKQELADQLEKALKQEFNDKSFSISHGIGSYQEGIAFMFSISVADNSNDIVEQNVVDFASAKLKEWETGIPTYVTNHPPIIAF